MAASCHMTCRKSRGKSSSVSRRLWGFAFSFWIFICRGSFPHFLKCARQSDLQQFQDLVCLHKFGNKTGGPTEIIFQFRTKLPTVHCLPPVTVQVHMMTIATCSNSRHKYTDPNVCQKMKIPLYQLSLWSFQDNWSKLSSFRSVQFDNLRFIYLRCLLLIVQRTEEEMDLQHDGETSKEMMDASSKTMHGCTTDKKASENTQFHRKKILPQKNLVLWFKNSYVYGKY